MKTLWLKEQSTLVPVFHTSWMLALIALRMWRGWEDEERNQSSSSTSFSWNRLSMPINKMLNHSYQTSFRLILKCSYGVSSCSLCSTDLWWEDVFLFRESLPTRLDELRTFVKCFRLWRWGGRGFSALLMRRQIRVRLTQQSEKPTLSLCSHSCKWKELKGFSRNLIFLKPGTQSSCATAL